MFIKHYNRSPTQCSKTRKQNHMRIENKLFDDTVIYIESPIAYKPLEKLSQIEDIIYNSHGKYMVTRSKSNKIYSRPLWKETTKL